MRRAAKVDANQTEIVDALRAAGASVQSLAPVGKGCPDLLVGRGKLNILMEIKDGTGKLTPDQKEWHEGWRGRVHLVRSVDDALAVLRYWTTQSPSWAK